VETIRRAVLAAALVSALAVTAGAGPSSRKLFIDSWRGRRVEVKQTLVTLVFDERGHVRTLRRNRREGLTVVTPSGGVFFRFDGRDSEQDIVDADAQQVMERVAAAYLRDAALEEGFFRRIDPQLLVRYERGGALVVTDVRIDRDRVRLLFGALGGDASEPATSLTVQWPTDLSAGLSEAPLIDGLIRRFVDRSEAP
jgi:hypothetical protein